MKPREFWITEDKNRPDNHAAWGMVRSSIHHNAYDHDSDYIHVREIVPIDWFKIRQEAARMEQVHYGLKEIFNKIQELVEKQLKGKE